MAKKNGAADDSSKAERNEKLPLFYNDPIPLDKQKHADLALKKGFTFSFTKEINAVPVNMIEMPQICHYYPIAFSPDASATPVAILGLRDNENLFVNENGEWAEQAYIPAYIRRYPFIFSEIPGSDQLTLCVDMNDEFIAEDGEQKFFEDGEPSQMSKNALEFCKSYHAAAQQTVEFGKELAALDILVDREAKINVGNKAKINFSGFKIIDEKKLADIPDEKFLEWRQKGWLPFIYAHLFSGGQWQRLTRLLGDKMEDKAA